MTRTGAARTRPAARRAAGLVAALAATLAMGGCGVTDAVVGIHAAPAEDRSVAAVDQDNAQRIAARVLGAAQSAQAKTGTDAATALEAALTGAALAVGQAAVATHSASATAPDPLTNPGAPKVLAVSQGRTWPRAILAATLDETANRQYLHVLVSSSPTDPFRLAYTVPMHAGASIPSLGTLADGAPLVPASDATGLVAAPQDLLAEYAGALAYPKAQSAPTIPPTDPFARSLLANAQSQTASLGKLGSLAEKQSVVADDTISFRLADGGAVTFGLLKRVDTITLAKSAKELKLPSAYARLSGKKTVTKSVTVVSLEPVVLVIPTSGTATAVGGDEQLVSVAGH